VPKASGDHHDFLFDWLPWPAQLAATVPWLHRAHDSAARVRSVLKDGLVPRPLRMAEAVMLHIAFDRAWVIDTNAFVPDGEEVDDPSTTLGTWSTRTAIHGRCSAAGLNPSGWRRNHPFTPTAGGSQGSGG
jgi:hypothetical protein